MSSGTHLYPEGTTLNSEMHATEIKLKPETYIVVYSYNMSKVHSLELRKFFRPQPKYWRMPTVVRLSAKRCSFECDMGKYSTYLMNTV